MFRKMFPWNFTETAGFVSCYHEDASPGPKLSGLFLWKVVEEHGFQMVSIYLLHVQSLFILFDRKVST